MSASSVRVHPGTKLQTSQTGASLGSLEDYSMSVNNKGQQHFQKAFYVRGWCLIKTASVCLDVG